MNIFKRQTHFKAWKTNEVTYNLIYSYFNDRRLVDRSMIVYKELYEKFKQASELKRIDLYEDSNGKN